jgi:hypothetical protein
MEKKSGNALKRYIGLKNFFSQQSQLPLEEKGWM